MTRRIATIVLALLVLALVAAQGANAASSSTIHKDAADGSIDGKYTLQEMRAADRTVPAEIREYFGWEDAYSAYLRRLSNPDAPPVVVPIDSNRDGEIDSKERDVAADKAREVGGQVAGGGDDLDFSPGGGGNDDECETDFESPDCADASAGNRDDDNEPVDDRDRDEDDGGSWLIWLIVGLPVLIVAVGAYRMAKRGKPGDGQPTTERTTRRQRRAARRNQDPRDL